MKNRFAYFYKSFPLAINKIDELSIFSFQHKRENNTNGEKLDPNDVWYYNINELGFRGDVYRENNLLCAFYGCSFTFGQGVKYQDTWPYLIGEKYFPSKWVNFGLMGESLRHLSDLFIASSNVYNIKNAIILTPPFSRNKFLLERRVISKTQHVNIYPQIEVKEPGYPFAARYYRMARDIDFFHLFMDNVIKITLNSKLKNINLIWACFEKDTAEAFDALKIPYYFWHEDLFADRGREKSHPGPIANALFADRFSKYLERKLIYV